MSNVINVKLFSVMLQNEKVHLFVPPWYVEAKTQGATPQELKEKVRMFCAEALLGAYFNIEDISCDSMLVSMAFEMYEEAFHQQYSLAH